MTDRDVLAAARACAEQGMCADSLRQVFELPWREIEAIFDALERPPEAEAEAVPKMPPAPAAGIVEIDRDQLADLMAEDLSEAEIAKRLNAPLARVRAEIKSLNAAMGA